MITSIISFDPSTITITRHTQVPHAGGYSWNETTLAPFTGRLYFINTRNQREYTLPEGGIKMITLGLLALPRTDIVVGHDSYDTFEVYDTSSPPVARTFRIVGVRIYDDINMPACVQADCVAV